jgi:acetyltransferase
MSTIALSGPSQDTVSVRSVASTDTDAMRAFVVGLGAASRRWRFHGGIDPCSQMLLRHLTQVDGWRHVAFVACAGYRIVGEARYVRELDGEAAEFAIAVTDACQGQGVARALLGALIDAARRAGIKRLYGDVLSDNERMAGFMSHQGFAMDISQWDATEGGVDRWVLQIAAPSRWPTVSRLLSRVVGRVTNRAHATH